MLYTFVLPESVLSEHYHKKKDRGVITYSVNVTVSMLECSTSKNKVEPRVVTTAFLFYKSKLQSCRARVLNPKDVSSSESVWGDSNYARRQTVRETIIDLSLSLAHDYRIIDYRRVLDVYRMIYSDWRKHERDIKSSPSNKAVQAWESSLHTGVS